jgi:hypothetical protein
MGWFRDREQPEEDATPSFEARLAAIGPGVPGRCPACDGHGYIDRLDIGHKFQIQHCKDCGHRWEYLFDADGHVVGLTELDHAGQPVSRTRVRRPAVVDARSADEAGDDVVDLRDPAPEPSPPTPPSPSTAPAEATHLSPAEWLRQSIRR